MLSRTKQGEKNFYVSSDMDGWRVYSGGPERPSIFFPRKDDAIFYCRELAKAHQPAQCIILGRGGAVEDQRVYRDGGGNSAKTLDPSVLRQHA